MRATRRRTHLETAPLDMAGIDRSIETVIKVAWVAVWRHKFAFLATSGGLFTVALVAMLRIQPMYEGATLLISGQMSLEQLPDSSHKPAETPEALARIGDSEEVVGDAIEKVGLSRLALGGRPDHESLFARLRHAVFPSRVEPAPLRSALDAAIPQIKQHLTVHTETSSDVIRISFRDKDPLIAAQFANAVAQAFVDRHILLYSRPGAADFFMRQQERFESDGRAAADALQKLATRTGIYSAEDQKQLLLKRQSDLESALALTRGLITQDTGERQALAQSLHQLAPVSRSPYVSALVDSLSGGPGQTSARSGDPRALLERESDPPILLIKVYQDSMVTLFKTNADLQGAQSIETEQIAEIAKIKADLDSLTQNEQEYIRLTRAITMATYNADIYAKRMVEEQITAESNAARFSSLKVIQRATAPLRPVTPNYPVIFLAAVMGSVLVGLGVALLLDRRRSRGLFA